MSLVELPGVNGKIIAVNPHHVSACQPYTGHLNGKPGKHEMTAVWVNNHNIYICAWSIEHVLEVLHDARKVESQAFRAGYTAGLNGVQGSGGVEDIITSFESYTGKTGEPEVATGSRTANGHTTKAGTHHA